MVLVVLLGWAVALLNRRARHKSLVTIVGTLLFLAVYYAVFQWVGNAVEALAVDAVQAGAAAGRAAAPLRLLGLAAVGNVPALLLFLALAAACMALCGKALAKPYLRLLTLEPGRAKVEYRAKTQKKQPPRRALLRRELLHLGACPMWLLNCALSSLLLPVLGAAALWKAADLRAFTAAYPPESLPMLVCGMVCTIAAMNFITAPSVSLEGGTLWLLQSLPVAPQQVLRVKVELQLLLTLPGAWFCAGCAMAALRIPAGQGLLVLAVLGLLLWLVYMGTPFAGKGAGRKEVTDWGFLKSTRFWLLTGLLFCQNAAEQSVTGWMVTYFKGSGIIAGALAAYTVTVMWGATLVARLLIAFVFPFKQPRKAMVVMGVSCTIFYILLVQARSQGAAIALLFAFAFAMAGMNPTAVASAGRMTSVTSMGIMLPVAASGAILMPWVIGMVAEGAGLAAGMMTNIIPCVGLVLFAILVARLPEE